MDFPTQQLEPGLRYGTVPAVAQFFDAGESVWGNLTGRARTATIAAGTSQGAQRVAIPVKLVHISFM